MEFEDNVPNGQRNNWLDFGGDLDHIWIQNLFKNGLVNIDGKETISASFLVISQIIQRNFDVSLCFFTSLIHSLLLLLFSFHLYFCKLKYN